MQFFLSMRDDKIFHDVAIIKMIYNNYTFS